MLTAAAMVGDEAKKPKGDNNKQTQERIKRVSHGKKVVHRNSGHSLLWYTFSRAS
jgi:hypothetical protein